MLLSGQVLCTLRDLIGKCPISPLTAVAEGRVGLGGAGDVTGEPTALTTAEGYLCAWADIWLIGSAFDRTGA